MLPLERIGRIHVLPVLAVAALALGMRSPRAGLLLRPVYDETAYPARAVALLTDPTQRIFTHDEWGDYLIYRLSPLGGRVYVDGRSDFYGGEFAKEYMDLLHVKYDWEHILARYGVTTVLLPPDAALASTLKESQHWRTVYDDGVAIVFRVAQPATVSQVSAASQGGETSVYQPGARGSAPLPAQLSF